MSHLSHIQIYLAMNRIIEVTGRRGRRRKKLLDDLKEKRGYCKLKKEALDLFFWRTRSGSGYGPVACKTANKMNELMDK